jgi:CDP-diacylglycerol--glycerol-3-phosphate 3-phosphatidyltransferase
MFTPQMQAWGRRVAEVLVRPLAVRHVSPNAVTIVGLTLNMAVALVLALGDVRVGGGLLLLAGGFDMLDGALARVTQRFSPFGAFLDSVLDRYSEAIVGLGLLYNQLQHNDTLTVALLYALLVGSFMISYSRARAEGLGLECKTGLLPRPERILLLAIGLLFKALVPVLIVLVILTQITALQRIFHVWKVTRTKCPDDLRRTTNHRPRVRVPDDHEMYT